MAEMIELKQVIMMIRRNLWMNWKNWRQLQGQ